MYYIVTAYFAILALASSSESFEINQYRLLVSQGGFVQQTPYASGAEIPGDHFARVGSEFVITEQNVANNEVEVRFTHVENNQEIKTKEKQELEQALAREKALLASVDPSKFPEHREEIEARITHSKTVIAAIKAELAAIDAGVDVRTSVKTGVLYRIPREDLRPSMYYVRNGMSAGPISVPFKFIVDGSDIISGGALSGYLGYKRGRFNAIGSFGLSVLSTTRVDPANSERVQVSNGEAALTIAGGFIFDVYQDFQAGLLFGTDLKNEYEYDGKLWISAGIGYLFTPVF